MSALRAAILCLVAACVVTPADAQSVNGWNLGASVASGTSFPPITAMSQLPSYFFDYEGDNATNSSGVTSWLDTGPSVFSMTSSGAEKPVYAASALNGHAGVQGILGNPSWMGSASMPWATKQATIYLVEQAVTTGLAVTWETTAAAYLNNGIADQTNSLVLNNGGAQGYPAKPTSGYQVFVYQFDGTGNLYSTSEYFGRSRIGWGVPTTDASNFATGALNLFSRASTFAFPSSETIVRIVGFNGAHTAIQIQQGVDYLSTRYALNTTFPTVEGFVAGDSISSAYGTVTEQWAAHVILDGSYPHVMLSSVAYPGVTLATKYANRVAEVGSRRGLATWDSVTWLGTNDLVGCTDASGVPAVEANLIAYEAYIKTHGARHLGVATMLPRASTSELCREGTAGLNVRIRADAATYGWTVIDVGGPTSTIGAAGANTGSDFQSDNVHPNDTGQAYAYTNWFAPVFNAWGWN